MSMVDSEHSHTPEIYTSRYDAIVAHVKKSLPSLKFVGMALAFHKEWHWYEYFLNHSNHAPEIPIDFISYHFYATVEKRDDSKLYSKFFTQADDFILEVKQIESYRQRLSPTTRTTINEMGVILPGDQDPSPITIPIEYWNAAGAMYVYLFCNLALQRIDVLGESQLVGYPTQFPSVSMLDWTTGKPNSRYWVLKLLLDQVNMGDIWVKTSCSDSTIYAQAFISTNKVKKIIIINKTDKDTNILFTGAKSNTLLYIDETTNYNPPQSLSLQSDEFTLKRFGVGILILDSIYE